MKTNHNMDNNQQLIKDLIDKVNGLEKLIKKHQHDDVDETLVLRKTIEIDEGQILRVGLGDQASAPIQNIGSPTEQVQYSIAVGKDKKKGFFNIADNLQLNFLHQPNNALLHSFITAFRTPIVTNFVNQTITTVASGNTVTIDGFKFATNQLAGAIINIYDSSKNFIETQTIASNTSNVITISGTWIASTSGAIFQVYSPVFLGSADNIWQRFYAQEGIVGGIRFGVGPTNGGQNGLIYMDASGNLYWRNKSGSSISLGGGIGCRITSAGDADYALPAGWSVSKPSTGYYVIRRPTDNFDHSAVITTMATNRYAVLTQMSNNLFAVTITDSSGTVQDSQFNFIFS